MGKTKDITGQKFGRLTAIRFDHKNKNGLHFWLFKCDCGKEKIINKYIVMNGKQFSCGCLREELRKILPIKHGGKYTRLYNTWANMKYRCFNKKAEQYKRYGGRGITVCKEWAKNFENFRDWAMANGYNDTLSIDRINNEGNYEPSNCRWVDNRCQSRNRSTNTLLEYNGKIATIAEWAEIMGVSKNVISERLQRGWTIESTLSIPLIARKERKNFNIEKEN